MWYQATPFFYRWFIITFISYVSTLVCELRIYKLRAPTSTTLTVFNDRSLLFPTSNHHIWFASLSLSPSNLISMIKPLYYDYNIRLPIANFMVTSDPYITTPSLSRHVRLLLRKGCPYHVFDLPMNHSCDIAVFPFVVVLVSFVLQTRFYYPKSCICYFLICSQFSIW